MLFFAVFIKHISIQLLKTISGSEIGFILVNLIDGYKVLLMILNYIKNKSYFEV